MKCYEDITKTMPANLLFLSILGHQISHKAFVLSDQSKTYDEDFVKSLADMAYFIDLYVETALPLSLKEQYHKMVKEKKHESS